MKLSRFTQPFAKQFRLASGLRNSTQLLKPAGLAVIAIFALAGTVQADNGNEFGTDAGPGLPVAGADNAGFGFQALLSLTGGYDNTATGFQSLYSNTAGSDNTATGFRALYSNIEGFNNVASGAEALFSNTTGNNNTASG